MAEILLGLIWRKHYAPVHGNDAEDICYVVIAYILQKLNQCRNEEEFEETFPSAKQLISLAKKRLHGHVLDAARAAEQRKEVPLDERIVAGPMSAAGDPPEAVERNPLIGKLCEFMFTIADLTPREREAISLSYQLGTTSNDKMLSKDIAAKMRIKAGYARVLICRAKKKLIEAKKKLTELIARFGLGDPEASADEKDPGGE